MQAIGHVRGAQLLENELSKERRKLRDTVKESPAVADAFSRLRRAEDEGRRKRDRVAAEHAAMQRDATKAIADKSAAVADLRATKKHSKKWKASALVIMPSKPSLWLIWAKATTRQAATKRNKNRFEVLDRLARLNSGLSAGQKNDWPWFKEAWDTHMVEQHGADWASTFAGWIQNVMDDERSNAFSAFVCTDTCRVFLGTSALHVPGA